MFAPWWKFSTDAVMLALEAQGVIAIEADEHRFWARHARGKHPDGERKDRCFRRGRHDAGDWWLAA